MNAIRFPEVVFQQMINWVEKNYPKEACGIIIGIKHNSPKKIVTRIVPSKNVSKKDKGTTYTVDPLLLAKVEQELMSTNEEIIGFFHSHVNVEATPSEMDLKWAWPTYVYLIISLKNRQAVESRAWMLKGENLLQMKDKKFEEVRIKIVKRRHVEENVMQMSPNA